MGSGHTHRVGRDFAATPSRHALLMGQVMTEPPKARTVLGQLPFAHSLVDRDYLGRDDADLASDPDSRFIVVAGGKALLASANELAHLPFAEIPDGAELVYLGRIEVPHFAAVVP